MEQFHNLISGAHPEARHPQAQGAQPEEPQRAQGGEQPAREEERSAQDANLQAQGGGQQVHRAPQMDWVA